jgi:hypothetical protein
MIDDHAWKRLVGQHLTVRRQGFTHHGVCVDTDRVMHYGGLSGGISDKNSGGVSEVWLGEFLLGQPLRVRHYRRPRRRFNQVNTVWRARSRLGENVYGLLDNNCENFASWCVTGVDRSEQVDIKRTLGLLGVVRIVSWIGQGGGQFEDVPWEHFVYNLYHPWEWDFDESRGPLQV